MRIIIAIVILAACNPVKQVLRDKQKFDKVAEEVFRKGMCANDTTYISKSDTIVSTDTINNIYIDTEYRNDTVYLTKLQTKLISKKVYIRDTFSHVIVDNSRINVLEADKASISMDMNKWKDKAQDRLKWLVLLIVGLGLWIFFKIKP